MHCLAFDSLFPRLPSAAPANIIKRAIHLELQFKQLPGTFQAGIGAFQASNCKSSFWSERDEKKNVIFFKRFKNAAADSESGLAQAWLALRYSSKELWMDVEAHCMQKARLLLSFKACFRQPLIIVIKNCIVPVWFSKSSPFNLRSITCIQSVPGFS